MVEIGNGTSVNATTGAAPINIWYRSLRGQMVYTAAEINAAGFTGPGEITHLGFYVTQTPLYSLPNFLIRMKHTTATNASSHDSGPYQTVYSTVSYSPVAGGWDILELDTPFEWNGVDNILVDTAFAQTSTYNSSGQQWIFDSPNGSRYARSDSADQTNVPTNSISNYKPQIKMMIVSQSEPPTLDIPEIIGVDIIEESIYISWLQVEGATAYEVESCETIDGEFLTSTASGTFSQEGNIVTWQSPLSGPMKFYRVKAVLDMPVLLRTTNENSSQFEMGLPPKRSGQE